MKPSTTSSKGHMININASSNDPDQSNKSLLHKSPKPSDDLSNFQVSLKWWALNYSHSTSLGKFISYFIFILLTIVVPILTSVTLKQSTKDPISYSKLVQLPESGLAAIAFFTLSAFFRNYGLRQLLFLDGLEEDTSSVRKGYTREVDKAFKCLAYILLPSFFIELAHKICFFTTVKVSLPYMSPSVTLNFIVFVLVVASWVYRTGVFLLVCILFRLTCELQILRFEGLHKFFEGCHSNSRVIFQEHVRIRKQLWITSHRYRFFIIGCWFTTTVSQFAALMMVLASKAEKTFLNSGDLVVCSAVELSGMFLCLMEAARMTHRAQGIVAIATRWHMLLTSSAARMNSNKEGKDQSPEANGGCNGENENDSSGISTSISPDEPSSFQTRQALVSYLGHNHGGITLFGFALDRGMLHIIFAFEFSLVLWVLSKVVVLS
ncbi:LOW QUALITY PROTEIN: uncharacterized protein LOC126784318 [Argentina anserina]|uniref:LOW QUALITY PROTEIN: uncharacterized protein LOC126784318 n=1 Tax=Argentina anserina TaxID=57926 RepID=UPI00217657ED|nr:LOW QUALITY PROTEIN: uncharacterized protein LOC126784318 [Potentilla anserina]